MNQQLWLTKHPIVQAPMAGCQDHRLLLAVYRAGGLGSLPAAMFDVLQLKKELQHIQAAHCDTYLVNFFAHTPSELNEQVFQKWLTVLAPIYARLGVPIERVEPSQGRMPFQAEHLDLMLQFKPKVVSFHFGLPAIEMVRVLQKAGIYIWSTATTVDEVFYLEGKQVDGIIVQGLEAGGHRGHFLRKDLQQQMPLLDLLRQIKAKVHCPLIAAGGIASAYDVQAALAMGASAVQVGTAFLLCSESTTSMVHRNAIVALLKSLEDNRVLDSPNGSTAITNVFTGRPARGLRNLLMNEIGIMRHDVPDFPWATSALVPLRKQAEALDLCDYSPLWAGTRASACKTISAQAVIESLTHNLD